MLSDLLNPKGLHGQSSAYLKLFLQDCLGMVNEFSDEQIGNFRVIYERFIDAKRTIDITIEGNGRFIPIVAKIDADEQDNECYDACTFAQSIDKQAKLVFLTLFGRACEPNSRGQLKDEDILLISFESHILKWLEKCLNLPGTANKPPIHVILTQFITSMYIHYEKIKFDGEDVHLAKPEDYGVYFRLLNPKNFDRVVSEASVILLRKIQNPRVCQISKDFN